MFVGLNLTSPSYAIELFVDTKTKQIYTESGPNRERLGTFERVEDKPTQIRNQSTLAKKRRRREKEKIKNKPEANYTASYERDKSLELRIKAATEQLTKKIDLLEKEIQKYKNTKVTRRRGHLRLLSKVEKLEGKIKESDKTKMRAGSEI